MINFYFSDKNYNDNIGLMSDFDEICAQDWFDNELAMKIVEDIDNSKMLVPGIFTSEVVGNYTHKELSGGSKALLCMLNTDKLRDLGYTDPITIASSLMGDNCMKWVIEISKQIEINIKVTHFLEFPEDVTFEGYAPELNLPITSDQDLARISVSEEVEKLMNDKYEEC